VSVDSGGKRGVAYATFGDGGLDGACEKGGLVAKAMVARVSIVEFDLP
jgi:hypothetical protein